MGNAATDPSTRLVHLDNLPDVLLLPDLAALLNTSTRTIQRRLDQRAFPIKPLASIDRKLRWSKAAVATFLAGRTR